MLRSRRESPHSDGITEQHNVQQAFATKSASSGREQAQQNGALFDHHVGAGEEGFGDSQTERLCRRQIDNKLEFVRLLDWNITGRCSA
jgi:hypothetical protein